MCHPASISRKVGENMQDIYYLFASAQKLFQSEFTLMGYTLSFEEIIIFLGLGGILMWFIGRLLE